MDKLMTRLLSVGNCNGTARVQAFIKFAKDSEELLSASLVRHVALESGEELEFEYLNSYLMPAALGECLRKAEHVPKLVQLRATFPKISKLVFHALAAAVGQLVASDKAQPLPLPEEKCCEKTTPWDDEVNSVFQRERDKMVNTVTKYAGINKHTAEDVVQQTYVRLIERARSGHERPRFVRPYCFRSAINAAFDILRNTKGECATLPNEKLIASSMASSTNSESPENPYEGKSEDSASSSARKFSEASYESLIVFLFSIEPNDRELFVANHVDKLPPRHIVQKLYYLFPENEPSKPSNISRRLYQLINIFEKYIKDNEAGNPPDD